MKQLKLLSWLLFIACIPSQIRLEESDPTNNRGDQIDNSIQHNQYHNPIDDLYYSQQFSMAFMLENQNNNRQNHHLHRTGFHIDPFAGLNHIEQQKLQHVAYMQAQYIQSVLRYDHAMQIVQQKAIHSGYGHHGKGSDMRYTSQDLALIEQICRDNPHWNHCDLTRELLCNPIFNLAAGLPNVARAQLTFPDNIYINPDYFTSALIGDMRLQALHIMYCQKFQKAHARETQTFTHEKAQALAKAKKISKAEHKKVKNFYKAKEKNLQKRQAEELQYPLRYTKKFLPKKEALTHNSTPEQRSKTSLHETSSDTKQSSTSTPTKSLDNTTFPQTHCAHQAPDHEQNQSDTPRHHDTQDGIPAYNHTLIFNLPNELQQTENPDHVTDDLHMILIHQENVESQPNATISSDPGALQSNHQESMPKSIKEHENYASASFDPELQQLIQKAHDQYQAARKAHGYEPNDTFNCCMNQRTTALEKSLENPTISYASITIPSQVAGYLQAQGIDVSQFTNLQGLPIQHCITQELVEILSTTSDIAWQQHHHQKSYQMSQSCTILATFAQNLNQQGMLDVSLQGTDLCHALQYFLQGVCSATGLRQEHISNCMRFCQATLDQSISLVESCVQGAIGAGVFEYIIAQGMRINPALTTGFVSGAFGLAAAALAFNCLEHSNEIGQGLYHGFSAGLDCILLKFNNAYKHVQEVTKLIDTSSVAHHTAHFVGGCIVPTPVTHQVISQILSYRPVIATYTSQQGQRLQNFYMMTQSTIEQYKNYLETLSRHPEYQQWFLSYKKFLGSHFFTASKKELSYMPALINHADHPFFEKISESIIKKIYLQESEHATNQAAQDVATNIVKQVVKQEINSIIQTETLQTNNKIISQEVAEIITDALPNPQASTLISQTIPAPHLESMIPSPDHHQLPTPILQDSHDLISNSTAHVLENIMRQTDNQLTYDYIEQYVNQGLISNLKYAPSYIRNAIQQELSRAMQDFTHVQHTNLSQEISVQIARELAELAPSVRQLAPAAQLTNNFQDLNKLDHITKVHCNRIYELQPYRTQIKNFIDTHKPYFIFEEQIYEICDIASYHIHAGEISKSNRVSGAHSNYGGHKLEHFKPTVEKVGPLGAKQITLYNPYKPSLTKTSSIYPESWPEYYCDLTALIVVLDKHATFDINKKSQTIEITSSTDEGLKIIVIYDIAHKRIKTHYPHLKD